MRRLNKDVCLKKTNGTWKRTLMFIRNYYTAYIEKDIERPLVSGAEVASCLIVIHSLLVPH